MNIFYFDECPIKSAQAQPDKMLVKMPLETAQMLSTAHRVLDGDKYADKHKIYKAAYVNHPCTIWARETSGNYSWLYAHFIALCKEYEHRYYREHLSYTKLAEPLSRVPENIKIARQTPIALAMPDQYKEPDDPILSYRQYVIAEKKYAMWNKNRKQPTWWPA